MSSRPAPFSVIYFQVVEVSGDCPDRYLARYVGPARGPVARQAELFADPAFMTFDLEALDLHVLPAWIEDIEPPAWFKRLLTPPSWSWYDLPPRTLEDAGTLEALKQEFGVRDGMSVG